jgi:hypothetical protein
MSVVVYMPHMLFMYSHIAGRDKKNGKKEKLGGRSRGGEKKGKEEQQTAVSFKIPTSPEVAGIAATSRRPGIHMITEIAELADFVRCKLTNLQEKSCLAACAPTTIR